MSQVIGLFPTPLMRVKQALDENSIAALIDRFGGTAAKTQTNAKSANLSHTEMVAPSTDPQFSVISGMIAPGLTEFGILLFGEPLTWSIKEMWINVLEKGGSQALHNHANSFASGVIYLTRPHESASTVFSKGPGNGGFVFANAHRDTNLGPFNADKWVMPAVGPGDMILFPSHLLHEVPVNKGERRISLAFNAIPERLNSWGYAIRFSA